MAITRTKTSSKKRTRQFLVDEKGRRTGVILTPEEYEELIEAAEQLDDIRHLEEAKKVRGKPILWEQFEAELRSL